MIKWRNCYVSPATTAVKILSFFLLQFALCDPPIPPSPHPRPPAAAGTNIKVHKLAKYPLSTHLYIMFSQYCFIIFHFHNLSKFFSIWFVSALHCRQAFKSFKKFQKYFTEILLRTQPKFNKALDFFENSWIGGKYTFTDMMQFCNNVLLLRRGSFWWIRISLCHHHLESIVCLKESQLKSELMKIIMAGPLLYHIALPTICVDKEIRRSMDTSGRRPGDPTHEWWDIYRLKMIRGEKMVNNYYF